MAPPRPSYITGAMHHWWTYRRRLTVGIMAWLTLTAIAWIAYLPFLAGLPGCHWLALGYSRLLGVTFAWLLVSLFSLPLLGLAFGILLVTNIYGPWRSRSRQGIRQLLLLLLIELMGLIALAPNFAVQYDPMNTHAIAPWHVKYRAVYVAPLDNNYGDLMLLKCRWLGLCHQVYRHATDITSAERADIAFNPTTHQVALHLESRWVYVRSPDTEPCQEIQGDLVQYGKCTFQPDAL